MEENKYYKIIIVQCHGLGDILWATSIAHDFVDEGHRVLWPVEDYIYPVHKHFNRFAVMKKGQVMIDYNSRQDVTKDGTRIIPLRFADSICKVPYKDCMKSKYQYFGKDWTKWKDNFSIIRDTAAEDKLYYEVLGLKDGEQYNFISEVYAGKGALSVRIPPPRNGLKNVHLSIMPGFTLIDWLKVMGNAVTIHAVSSSNIYLFELFHMRAEKIHIYVRRPLENNHDNYDYILTKDNYVLMP